MPAIDQPLREKTYKEAGITLDRRVFHTLADDRAIPSTRTVKAVSLLVQLLVEKRVITEEEVDALLLECTKYTR